MKRIIALALIASFAATLAPSGAAYAFNGVGAAGQSRGFGPGPGNGPGGPGGPGDDGGPDSSNGREPATLIRIYRKPRHPMVEVEPVEVEIQDLCKTSFISANDCNHYSR